jgi:hypothetical protein
MTQDLAREAQQEENRAPSTDTPEAAIKQKTYQQVYGARGHNRMPDIPSHITAFHLTPFLETAWQPDGDFLWILNPTSEQIVRLSENQARAFLPVLTAFVEHRLDFSEPPCPECQGEGIRQVITNAHRPDALTPTYASEVCDDCQGTGTIEVLGIRQPIEPIPDAEARTQDLADTLRRIAEPVGPMAVPESEQGRELADFYASLAVSVGLAPAKEMGK